MPDDAIPQKRCCTCGETKSIELFSRNKSEKDGRQRRCKICVAKYYAANTEAVCSHVKAYREANPEVIRQRKKAYREANAEYIREWKKAHYQDNHAEILAHQRVY